MGFMIAAPGTRRTAARILWRVRLLALGDRNPEFLTHREIDSTLKLLPADVECRWVATDDPRARELASYDGVWLLPGTPYREDEAASRDHPPQLPPAHQDKHQ